MKITEITASFGATKQLAPYEPVNFHVSLKAEVVEGEDIGKAQDRLFKAAKAGVRTQMSELKNKERKTAYHAISEYNKERIRSAGKGFGLTDIEIDSTIRQCKNDKDAIKVIQQLTNEQPLR